MALSLQLAEDVAAAVPVVEASGVEVGGTRVGTVRACRVGGRVEVTKRGGAGVGVSIASEETFTHEVNVETSRRRIQIFFMR
jgi:hypothetical protein